MRWLGVGVERNRLLLRRRLLPRREPRLVDGYLNRLDASEGRTGGTLRGGRLSSHGRAAGIRLSSLRRPLRRLTLALPAWLALPLRARLTLPLWARLTVPLGS